MARRQLSKHMSGLEAGLLQGTKQPCYPNVSDSIQGQTFRHALAGGMEDKASEQTASLLDKVRCRSDGFRDCGLYNDTAQNSSLARSTVTGVLAENQTPGPRSTKKPGSARASHFSRSARQGSSCRCSSALPGWKYKLSFAALRCQVTAAQHS